MPFETIACVGRRLKTSFRFGTLNPLGRFGTSLAIDSYPVRFSTPYVEPQMPEWLSAQSTCDILSVAHLFLLQRTPRCTISL